MLDNYYFAACVPGHYGLQCSKSCVAPFYGVGCQKLCSNCPTSLCDVSYGCPRITGKISLFLFDNQLIEYNLHNYNILTIFSMQ